METQDGRGKHIRTAVPNQGAGSCSLNLPPEVVDKLDIAEGGPVVLLIDEERIEIRAVDIGHLD